MGQIPHRQTGRQQLAQHGGDCRARTVPMGMPLGKDVVKNGTGTKAQVDGLSIAGKTGSAESSSNGQAVTHAWFVGYLDSETAPYAVCVMVEEGGSGGSVAAPIAGQIFAYLGRMGQ